MIRRVFYSFHYSNDAWRASMIRNIGSVEGNRLASDNDWETIKKGRDPAIRKWIDDQMHGRSCVVILVGEKTASRKWIKYEIKRAIELKKGLVGIQIHKLKDGKGLQSCVGKNPFDRIKVKGIPLTKIVKIKKSRQITSRGVYNHIAEYLPGWIEEAIENVEYY